MTSSWRSWPSQAARATPWHHLLPAITLLDNRSNIDESLGGQHRRGDQHLKTAESSRPRRLESKLILDIHGIGCIEGPSKPTRNKTIHLLGESHPT
jgi:hypothetical protein